MNTNPASILYKSIADRYWLVRMFTGKIGEFTDNISLIKLWIV